MPDEGGTGLPGGWWLPQAPCNPQVRGNSQGSSALRQEESWGVFLRSIFPREDSGYSSVSGNPVSRLPAPPRPQPPVDGQRGKAEADGAWGGTPQTPERGQGVAKERHHFPRFISREQRINHPFCTKNMVAESRRPWSQPPKCPKNEDQTKNPQTLGEIMKNQGGPFLPSAYPQPRSLGGQALCPGWEVGGREGRVGRFSVWQTVGLGVGSGRELRGLGERKDLPSLTPRPPSYRILETVYKNQGQRVEEKGVIRIKN